MFLGPKKRSEIGSNELKDLNRELEAIVGDTSSKKAKIDLGLNRMTEQETDSEPDLEASSSYSTISDNLDD